MFDAHYSPSTSLLGNLPTWEILCITSKASNLTSLPVDMWQLTDITILPPHPPQPLSVACSSLSWFGIFICQFYITDLRKQARQLENELDLKLVSFSKLCTSYSTSRDGRRGDRYVHGSVLFCDIAPSNNKMTQWGHIFGKLKLKKLKWFWRKCKSIKYSEKNLFPIFFSSHWFAYISYCFSVLLSISLPFWPSAAQTQHLS